MSVGSLNLMQSATYLTNNKNWSFQMAPNHFNAFSFGRLSHSSFRIWFEVDLMQATSDAAPHHLGHTSCQRWPSANRYRCFTLLLHFGISKFHANIRLTASVFTNYQ